MTGVLVLLAGAALAQDASNSSANCWAGAPFPSAQTDLIRVAADDNANLYGAVGTAERITLPLMHEHEDMAIFTFESRVLAGAFDVPVRAGGDCEDRLLRAPVDLTSSNWGLGWSRGDFGLFYNSSVTTTITHGGGPMRAVLDPTFALVSSMYGVVAPFFPTGERVSDSGIMAWDWIAGAEYTPGTVAIRAGYVGSNGAYFQASEKTTRAFIGVAANESFARLPYLRGGLERLAIGDDADGVGRTSLFGRRLFLPGVRGAAPSEEEVLTTTHLNQENIAGLFDVRMSYALQPTPFVHEARVGVHTYNFLDDMRNDDWAVRATAGMATMPARPDLDVSGGRRFAGTLEANYAYDGRRGYSVMELSAKYNDPEVLAAFPYAEDALEFYFMLSFGQL